MGLAAQIQERHRRFHADIARRAEELRRPKETVQPRYARPLRKLISLPVEFYWTSMWFYDLVCPRPAKPQISVGLIQRIVCQDFEITLSEMVSPRRGAKVVLPRQVAYYIAKTMTARSYPEIGRIFGGRDHTTVLYGVTKIQSMCDDNPEFAARVERIKLKIRSVT